ncbi:MAG: type VI secretion system protein TssA [Bryobacterales bacterium]|nr:type VI secretion system protein TssA [Bryobacterales bacterium]
MPLRDDLLKPIPGSNPAGANLRYDPITDKIKEARREDIDAPQGQWKTSIKTADPREVIKLASDVLAKRSKDIQIAVWLVDAHIRREGFPLLAPCFRLLRDLLETYWDTCYPEVEDGDVEMRASPLEWLGNKLDEPIRSVPFTSNKLSYVSYLESRMVGYEADANTSEKEEVRNQRVAEGKLTAEQFDEAADATSLPALQTTQQALADGLEALQELSDFCDERFGDDSPSFLKARGAIEEVAEVIRAVLNRRGVETGKSDEDEDKDAFSYLSEPEPQTEPEPEQEAEPEAEPAPEPEAEPEPDTSDISDWASVEADSDDTSSEDESYSSSGGSSEDDDPELICQQIADLCARLRRRNRTDCVPYLVMRAFRWGQMLNDYPNIDRDMLEAPDTSLRTKLKKLAQAGEWEEIVDATEEAMRQPFSKTWMDLQRFAFLGLNASNCHNASTAVRWQIHWILNLLPDLQELVLPDDTPSANLETREWIKTMVIPEKVEYVPRPPGEINMDSSGFDALSGLGDDSSSMDLGSSDSSDLGMDSEPSSDSLGLDSDVSSLDMDSTDLSSDLSSDTPAVDEPSAPAFAELDETPPILDENEPVEEIPQVDIELPEEAGEVAEEDAGPKLPLEPMFEEAIGAVKDGRTAQGLGIINKTLATERSGRGRFRRRTQLAHLLLMAGQTKIALPLLDQLAAEIENRRLEDWEQIEALAYPLELLMRCLAPEDHERRNELYVRLCRLDPVRALNVKF